MSDSCDVDLINRRTEIDKVVGQLIAALDRHHYPEPSKFAVRLAFEEALSNAFRHGHRGLPPNTPVHIEYQVRPEDLSIQIVDQGPGFNPDSIPDPTLDENLERPGGRGLMLMRAYMTRIDFDHPGNRVTLHYRRPQAR